MADADTGQRALRMSLKASLGPGLKQRSDAEYMTPQDHFKACFMFVVRDLVLLYSHQFVQGSISALYMLVSCLDSGVELPENFLDPNSMKILL
jgi:hypothetical protein